MAYEIFVLGIFFCRTLQVKKYLATLEFQFREFFKLIKCEKNFKKLHSYWRTKKVVYIYTTHVLCEREARAEISIHIWKPLQSDKNGAKHVGE